MFRRHWRFLAHTMRPHWTYEEILVTLTRCRVYPEVEICDFFTGIIDYLGHVIQPHCVEIATQTMNEIKGLRPPTKYRQALLFLQIVQFILSFRVQICTHSSPAYSEVEKDQPKYFAALSADEQNFMHEMWHKLVSTPILTLPYAEGRYTLDTDAPNFHVRCVLLQEHPNVTSKPAGYWCCSPATFEQAYNPKWRKWLAIVRFALMLYPYLEGTRFTIRTDHDSLKWIFIWWWNRLFGTLASPPLPIGIQCSPSCGH